MRRRTMRRPMCEHGRWWRRMCRRSRMRRGRVRDQRNAVVRLRCRRRGRHWQSEIMRRRQRVHSPQLLHRVRPRRGRRMQNVRCVQRLQAGDLRLGELLGMRLGDESRKRVRPNRGQGVPSTQSVHRRLLQISRSPLTASPRNAANVQRELEGAIAKVFVDRFFRVRHGSFG